MAKEKKKRGGVSEYFKGIRAEMKKVVWPTRKEMVVIYWHCNFDMRNFRTRLLVN